MEIVFDIKVITLNQGNFVLRDLSLNLDNKSLMELIASHISASFDQVRLFNKGRIFEEYMPEEHYDLKRFYNDIRLGEEYILHAILRLGGPKRTICREIPVKYNECGVCFIKMNLKWFYAIQPCMHIVCPNCSSKLMICPICRGEISDLIRVGNLPDQVNVYI